MGPQRDSKGPWGPDLIPTAANWSDWVGIMVTTNFGLVLGPLLDPEGPKEGPFWHKMTLFGPKRANMGPKFKMLQTYRVVNLQEKGTQPMKKKSILPILNLVLYWAPCGSKRDIYDQDGYFWGPWGSRKGPTPGKSVL